MAFRNYLARLQSMAGEHAAAAGRVWRGHPPELHRRAAGGDALGTGPAPHSTKGWSERFIFSFTDDWFAHGYPVENWAFGLTRREFDENGSRVAQAVAWRP